MNTNCKTCEYCQEYKGNACLCELIGYVSIKAIDEEGCEDYQEDLDQ